LVRAARRIGAVALDASPAQDANAFVVRRETARRYDLRTLIERVYGVEFGQVVALDVGGPLTVQSLESNDVDVGLLFTSDPVLRETDFVVLRDDRRLQPAENITPLVRDNVVERFGPDLVDALNDVSRRLSTIELRRVNAQVAADPLDVQGIAMRWVIAKVG
jgi:osmoprotectant transport system substrate-binding protein